MLMYQASECPVNKAHTTNFVLVGWLCLVILSFAAKKKNKIEDFFKSPGQISKSQARLPFDHTGAHSEREGQQRPVSYLDCGGCVPVFFRVA
jgi:hypothetical protein